MVGSVWIGVLDVGCMPYMYGVLAGLGGCGFRSVVGSMWVWGMVLDCWSRCRVGRWGCGGGVWEFGKGAVRISR